MNNWVHASIQPGTAEFSRHARFISAHAAFGCLAASLAPAYLAWTGSLAAAEIALSFVLASPLVWAWHVSRTGDLKNGLRGSFLTLTLLLAALIVSIDGFSLTALALMIIVPVEAALKGQRSMLRYASFISFMALIGVLAAKFVSEAGAAAPWIDPVIGLVLVVYMMSVASRVAKLRDQAERKFTAEQGRFRLLAENANDLITCHDPDGTTLFASPAARALMGVPASALLKSGMLEHIHLQDRVMFLRGVSSAIHDNATQEYHLRIRCKGAENLVWKWVAVRFRANAEADGSKPSAVAVMRDISASKSQELALKKAAERNEAAHNAQRRFVATMSHELRTPLNAIIGFSDMLRQELFGPMADARQTEYVGLIHDSGQHLLQVVNDMLDMSRIEAGRYELSLQSFQVTEIVDATLKMMQPLASAGCVTVEHHLPAGLPNMLADKRACQQILINILSNAIKFTPEGGSVRLGVAKRGQEFELTVRDTGIGMDESFLASLGQPFMQADNGNDREFEGTGLGLSVVKGLVALHGGEMDVKSIKGSGTTVTIKLPILTKVERPVPANGGADLVRLNNAPPEKSGAAEAQARTSGRLAGHIETETENEGDNRARVSA